MLEERKKEKTKVATMKGKKSADNFDMGDKKTETTESG